MRGIQAKQKACYRIQSDNLNENQYLTYEKHMHLAYAKTITRKTLKDSHGFGVMYLFLNLIAF